MLCSRCRESFKGIRSYLAHRAECRFRGWADHLAAVEKGKPRKAGRLAASLLGVERESKPLPPELLAKWNDPAARKAAVQTSRLKRAAIREAKHRLSELAKKRRRILC